MINENNVKCFNCGWTWEIETDDKNPFLCHKCGYDNKEKKFDYKSLENWKKINKMEEQKNEGLWDNIHAKRERGESPAKPGDKDYPKKDAWKKAGQSSKNENHDYVEDNEEEGGHYKMMLLNIKSIAEDINDLVGEEDNLPSWVQDKITIAEHNMDAILGYLISQNPDAFNDFEESEDDELDDKELDEAYNYLKKLNKFNSKDGKFELHEVDESHYSSLNEAEYQGRKVKLGKIMRGDVKKFKVFVKKPNGKTVKVNFGDPNMKIKKHIPARRKSFRARMKCDTPGPRWKARYWACRTW
jgi:transcription initiation factor TFIIIB Brf1 subunit/transcription initiation factor TFIIB